MVCLCTLIDDEMKIKVLFNCQEIIISLYCKCLWVGLRHEIDLCLCRSRAPIEGVVTIFPPIYNDECQFLFFICDVLDVFSKSI